MPIASQVLTPGAAIRSAWRSDGGGIHADAIRQAARTHFRFNIQVASELYWRGKQNDYNLSDDFGALRSPYDNCWMEWQYPATFFIDGKEAPSPHEMRLAAVVETGDVKDSDRIALCTQLLMQQPGSPITVMPVTDLFHTTADGNYVDGTRRWLYPEEYMSQSQVDAICPALAAELNVLYLALNLINCRNVKTERAGELSVRRSGRAKRRREPRLDYHTIVLPGMPSGSAHSASVALDVLPMHRVRGHFKRFTPEAPLMGQHVGTYWWGWQVRGNKDNGVVVSDYKVGAVS